MHKYCIKADFVINLLYLLTVNFLLGDSVSTDDRTLSAEVMSRYAHVCDSL